MQNLLLNPSYNNIPNYNTNIQKEIYQIERNQAKTHNQPEYFRQFDSLSFDNLSKPTGHNQAYITKSGFNTSLQRDLDFNNGYSEFQNTDMNYNVIPKEQFVHNNMTPFTSRRETMVDLNANSRKYENLSGNNTIWKHKNEIETFFEPTKNMSNVNGMPVVADQLSQRYIASFKNNNGALPFQTDVKVLPGLDGKQSAPYAVHRVEPRNIDALRSEINQKTSYMNKPLETIKKGDLSANPSQITKYKLPVYKEVATSDLIPTKHNVEGQRKTGAFVHTETSRGDTDTNYNGGAYNLNQGKTQDPKSINFTQAKKENFQNDFTHAINAVNSRPVFTNIESWTNYDTDRSQISQDVRATGAYNNNLSSYYNDINNVAKPTMKQNNIIQDRNIGAKGVYANETYMLSKDFVIQQTNRNTLNYNEISNIAPTVKNNNLLLNDTAKQTIRETTGDNMIVSNNAPTVKSNNLLYTDTAKQTIRESTSDMIISNNAPTVKSNNLLYTDKARKTIKETTSDNMIISNNAPTIKNNNLLYTDKARKTIKETTSDNMIISNNAPTVKSNNLLLNDTAKQTIRETTGNNMILTNTAPILTGYVIKNNDNAKPTIRQTTELNNYIGIVGGANNKENYSNLEDVAKPTIKETTIIKEYIGISGGDNNKLTYTEYNDVAKTTIKESTLTSTPAQNVIANVPQTYSKNDEIARSTIKETLLHQSQGNVYNINEGYYNINDEARTTIKQTTLLTDYNGHANYNVNGIRLEDAEYNMTIDEKRMQTALGARTPGAKSDQIRGNINKDTVRFNNRKTLYGYVSNPGKGKDYSVTPLVTNTTTNRKTNVTGNNFYRVDPIFIDKLNDNPLVNDIYHQKNIDFHTNK